MNTDINKLVEDLKKELAENDKKVAEEIKNKTPSELSKEFDKFIIENKCKIMGGKNGNK